MTGLHSARLVALVSLVLTVPGSVAATSRSEPATLRMGFLGSELHGDGSGAFVENDILRVPRNAAIYAGPPPSAEPRTWLARAGWKRYGLVRTDELPGG